MKKNSYKKRTGIVYAILFVTVITCIWKTEAQASLWNQGDQETGAESDETARSDEELYGEGMLHAPSASEESVFSLPQNREPTRIVWDPSWPYADYSVIHSGTATLYHASDPVGYTVCVNAGHGTLGGDQAQTLCHPDGTPKVTGGSTAEGSYYAAAVSYGTTMADGRPESAVTLSLAVLVKEILLEEGFDVLMIRESDDVQLDNIARSVIANQYADCHLALHYDSSAEDKGFFYISVPDAASYKSMEPVASHWQQHMMLGESILDGMRAVGAKIYGGGNMPLDLTQTSYSTIPSVDVELGDQASDCSVSAQNLLARGILEGVRRFFGII